MGLKNTDTRYGALSRLFHWGSALIILCLLLAGLIMTGMDNSPEKFQIYALHKSFGILILILVCARFGWRLYSPAPDEVETHAPWEKTLAKTAHIFLYLAMIGMPLSGWLMSSAGEFPVVFFGFNLPPLIDKNESLFHTFEFIHWALAYGLMGVIALHAAGAFKHYFIDADETLARMSFSKNPLLPLILVIITAGFFAAAGYLTFAPQKNQDSTAPEISQDAQPEAPVDFSALPAHGWTVIKEKTKIGFTAAMYGQAFTGSFNDYDAKIIFDPENLAGSLIDVRIKTASAETGNEERDAQIGAPDWFAAQRYQYAIYRTKVIEHIEGPDYIAVGDLTLRGVTLPVSLPFTLDISDKGGVKEARVQASAALSRLDFGIGQGQWEATDAVAAPVEVNIDLTARGK